MKNYLLDHARHAGISRKQLEFMARQSGIGNVDDKYDQSFGRSEMEKPSEPHFTDEELLEVF